MGLFDFFRKKNASARDDSQRDFAFANAYLEEVYSRIIGGPISLGIKLIGAELSSERPAQYNLVPTPEKFRLGVISYFGVLAAMLPERQGMFGVIYTTGSASAESYLQDRYGNNMATASNYLAAFGITIKRRYDYKFIKDKERILAIVPESVFNSRGGAGGSMFPVIKDDGKVAVMIAR